jgi:hypothetical protein
MATITIYTFGELHNLSEIAQGAGDCTDDAQAERLYEILDGADPVALSGYPETFIPCGNVLADIRELDVGAHDFELVEIEENENWYPSSGDFPYILPEAARSYPR